jgi:hypothetical protein
VAGGNVAGFLSRRCLRMCVCVSASAVATASCSTCSHNTSTGPKGARALARPCFPSSVYAEHACTASWHTAVQCSLRN